MFVLSLQSGSNGNSIYVEAGGVRLLFDAGISGCQARDRLAEYGRDITRVDALLVSHDHSDHCRSMGIFQRKFGMPIWTTAGSYTAAARRCRLGKISHLFHFRPGESLYFSGVRVETVPTPHDGTEGVAYVVDDGHERIGILTDLGHVFGELGSIIGSLDGAVLESNYDPAMLERGPYPPFLQRRIRGPGGHLSNREAAELVSRSAGSRLKWLCLGHLSEQNNSPALALQTHREVLGDELHVHVASRYQATLVARATPSSLL